MHSHEITLGIADLGVKTFTAGERRSWRDDFTAGRRNPAESGIERRRGIQVEKDSGCRWLAPGNYASADGWLLVRKYGNTLGARLLHFHRRCEDFRVELRRAIEVGRRDFEPGYEMWVIVGLSHDHILKDAS